MGGSAAPALERIGRLADGWFANVRPGPDLDESLATIRGAARDAGRDPSAIGLEGRISVGDGDLDRIAKEFRAWAEEGATHVSFNTMGAELHGVSAHVAALESALSAVRPL